jgi:tetratricopeptide (TPR) repeat protein
VDLEAWCEASLAEVARKQGRFDEAGARLDRAAARFAAEGDDAGRAQVLHLAGTVAAQKGDYPAARTNYLASLDLRRRADDEAAMASVLSNLGVVAEYDGDLEGARSYHEQALALRASSGDRWAIAVSNTNLGMISLLQNRPSDARSAFEEAMRLNLEVGDTWMVAISHNNLGNAWRDLGELEVALEHYAEAARPFLANDDKWALAFLFEDAALCLAALGRPEAAAQLLGASDRCRDDVGSPRPAALEADLTARLAPGGVASSLDAATWRDARARGQTLDIVSVGEFLLSACRIGVDV